LICEISLGLFNHRLRDDEEIDFLSRTQQKNISSTSTTWLKVKREFWFYCTTEKRCMLRISNPNKNGFFFQKPQLHKYIKTVAS